MARELRRSASARFWSKVVPEPNSGCWLWFRAQTRGYGVMGRSGTKKNVLAHRVAYEALVTAIPSGLEIDHKCRTPACVNPDHLEPVTHAENMRRSPVMRAGAGGALMFRNRRACPKGHPYSDTNTIVKKTKRGYRNRLCKICERARWTRSNERRRAS